MPVIRCPDTAPPFPTGSWNYPLHAEQEQNRLPLSGTCRKPSEARIKLDVAIVGAGVGGLATAIALRREGHRVQIYEGASALGEIGAGIQVPPNSATILHSWGLEEALRQKSVEPRNLYWKRWQDGSIVAKTRYRPSFRKWFGAPYYVVHRAHLHHALHEKAVELGVQVNLGRRVTSYDTEQPSMHFLDGGTVAPDLLIAADGLKSSAREAITGRRVPLRSHGFAAYRACVPVEEMKKHPIIRDNMDFQSNYLWVGDQAHVMSYSIVGGKDWNMVITVPELKEPCSWNQWESTDLKVMKSFFEGWDPTLTALLDLVQRTSKWPVLDIEQLDSWSSDNKKMILLGDAAHAMLPAMVQGASMAVEDAAGLAQALGLMRSKTQLPQAITAWESARIPRATAMQEASYRHMYTIHIPDGPQQRARDAAMAPEVNGEHYVESPNQWSDPTTQRWAFIHDPAATVRQAWNQIANNCRVPAFASMDDLTAVLRARL